MQNKKTAYQHSEIFYRTIGKGKPVLLLHGFGEDGTIWDDQVTFLQKDFYLIIPDLPGSGKSPLIENANIDTYAEIIKIILDVELIDKCIMIGHSMGGYVTLAFAQKYPQYLKGFGLFHSSAFADSEEKIIARKKSIEFIKNNDAFSFLKISIPGLFMGQTDSNPSDPYIERLIEKGKAFTSEALIQYYEAMIIRPDRTNVLKNFSKPILFIIGEYDNAVPLQSSLQQSYLPIQSHIHILKQSAHMGMLEETEKANTILHGFLQLID